MPPTVSFDSGKFPNDLGDFNDCQYRKDENVTFLTMSVYSRVAFSYQFVGMCVPNECVDYIKSQEFANNTQDYFNNAYMQATNTTVQNFNNLKFINPVESAPTVPLATIVVSCIQLCSSWINSGTVYTEYCSLNRLFCVNKRD
jgi:hypothetical protein